MTTLAPPSAAVIAAANPLRKRIDQALAGDDLSGDALRRSDPRHGAVLDLAPEGKP
ncbi:MAG TPA: hypothetical protein VFE59_05320 [Trebonia sp.]|nr:hypothetical protein [Trebonia sp.]